MTKTAADRKDARARASREIAQHYAGLAQEVDPAKVQAMEDALAALYEIRIERQRLKDEQKANTRRAKHAVRQAIDAGLGKQVVADAVGLSRITVWEYETGITQREHAKMNRAER